MRSSRRRGNEDEDEDEDEAEAEADRGSGRLPHASSASSALCYQTFLLSCACSGTRRVAIGWQPSGLRTPCSVQPIMAALSSRRHRRPFK